MLTVTAHTHDADFALLAPEWDRLAAEVFPQTPFRTSLWNQLWWKHFRRSNLRVRDDLRLFTFRNANGELVALAPMMLTRRPGVKLVNTREMQFLGADTNLTEIRGIASRPGCEVAAVQSLHAHLHLRQNWDWVQWRGLPPVDLTPVLPGFRVQRQLPDFYLTLPGDWDGFRSGLPRNIKESLRKCYNSLKRDGHEFQLTVCSDPAAIAPALAWLIASHADRSKRKDTIAHPDVFAGPSARAFMGDVMAGFAAQGRALIFSLEIAGKPVAMRAAFLCGKDLYLYYSGYDQDWAAYSVMTTTTAEAIKWAISKALRRVNLSTGSDVSKLRWRPEQVEFVEGIQEAKTLRSRLASHAVKAARKRRGDIF